MFTATPLIAQHWAYRLTAADYAANLA